MSKIDYSLPSAPSTRRRVALGLSGGVDSAVCAVLLKEAGYEVTAVYLECYREDGCRSEQDQFDALAVARQLELPLVTLDFRQSYQEQVLDYFFREYEAGRTPNPDVLCNREIKFGLFLDWAKENGYDWVATGHYAQTQTVAGQTYLVMAQDEKKDQTYFLNQIAASDLDKIIFPLGELTKTQVRALAAQQQLPVATKKDSTGVCFVGEINVKEFLAEKLGYQTGRVLNQAGEEIGSHPGAWFFTVGQRHGFTITNQQPDMPSLYVIKKNVDQNVIIVGTEQEIYTSELVVKDCNWLVNEADLTELIEQKMWVRIRHGGQLLPVSLTFKNNKKEPQVKLLEPARGVSEGQFAVFYGSKTGIEERLVCWGGGVIS